MTDHAELEGSVAALVLGAADGGESDSVRLHLGSCAGCRGLAGRLQRAADALPLATELLEPPPRLRSTILAAAAASGRTSTRPWSRTNIVRLSRERSSAWNRGRRIGVDHPAVAVAALALAVLGLGAWNLHLGDQLNRQVAPSAVARTTLSGRADMSGAQATVVDFKDQSVALVAFSRMPVLPPGRIYELWLIPASGSPEGVAVFQPESDGSKSVVLTRDLRRYRVIAVTVEAGPSGAQAPTQAPGLAGSTV